MKAFHSQVDLEKLESHLLKGIQSESNLQIPKEVKIRKKDKQPEGFDFLSASEIAKFEVESIQWLVQDLVPVAGLTYIAGLPKSGKSFTYTEIVRAVSTGTAFAGRFATRKTNVLIIDEENHRAIVRDRLGKMEMLECDNYKVCFRPRLKVTDEPRMQLLLEMCISEEIGLIVFDSLVRISLGLNENFSSDMAIVYNSLVNFLDAGIAIIMVHHKGKGVEGAGGGMRGTTEIAASADSVLILTKSGEDITVRQDMCRVAREVGDFTIRIEGEDTIRIVCVGNAQSPYIQAKEAVNTALNIAGQLNYGELIEAVKEVFPEATESLARHAIEIMHTEGKVEWLHGKGKTKTYQLRLGGSDE